MDLERRLQKAKKIGRGFVTGLVITSALSLGSCSKDSGTGPNDGGDHGNPPLGAVIRVIAPMSQEPSRGMRLSFIDISDNEEGFYLERREYGKSFENIANLPKNTEEYEDWKNIKASTFYSYRIKAHNEFGSSDWQEAGNTSTGPQIKTLSAKLEGDSFTAIGNPDQNFGNEGYISVTGFQSLGRRYHEGLFFFSIPNLPSYATYKSSELKLCEASGGSGAYPGVIELAVGLLSGPWDENSVTHNNSPGSWIGTYSFGKHNPNIPEERCVKIDVSKTCSYLYDGTYQNYGFVLTPANENSPSFCDYYSKEGYPSGAAKLSVSYVW